MELKVNEWDDSRQKLFYCHAAMQSDLLTSKRRLQLSPLKGERLILKDGRVA